MTWEQEEKRKRRYELATYRAVYRWYNGELRKVRTYLSEQGPEVALAYLPTLFTRESLNAVLMERYVEMGRANALHTYEKVKKDEQKRAVGFISDIIRAIIERIAGTRLVAAEIVGITDTSRAEVRAILQDGITQVLGARDIARRLSTQFARQRAIRIARTETTYIWNVAAEEGARATGLRLQKAWLSTSDARTRDTHRSMNGVTVDMEADFSVNGRAMSRPGDPRGGAKEVVNCRCVVQYRSSV